MWDCLHSFTKYAVSSRYNLPDTHLVHRAGEVGCGCQLEPGLEPLRLLGESGA